MGKRIAFWRYDLFPYVKWGTVSHQENFYSELMVQTEETGQGYWYRPFTVLDGEHAQSIIDNINALCVKRQTALREMEEMCDSQLKTIMEGLK